MSSFSDKLAIFQKNANKPNTSNKKNEKINKNKLKENINMYILFIFRIYIF